MSEGVPLRVAAVGCGLIAQTRHFQFIAELDAVRLEAVCDISPGTVEAVGERFGVAKRYVDHRQAVEDPDVDAVAVFTYDHADVVMDAIAAGKHVFVEKPLAFTPGEGRRIVAAADEAGVIVMVGYMKIYDPAVEWTAQRIRDKVGTPRSVVVHDFGGDFANLKRSDLLPVRVDDVPEAVASRRGKWNPEVMGRVAEALGPDHAGYSELFVVLLMLGCHDLGVLRAVLGDPTGVSYAREVDPMRAFAVLDFGDVPVVFEVGVGAKYQWWDEHLTVYGEEDEIRVEFDNPFVPFSPTLVRVREGLGPGVRSESRVNVGFDDGFRREWEHFAACVAKGEAPRSDAAMGLRDIELCVDIIRTMSHRPA